MCAHPTADIAAEAKSLFDKYGDTAYATFIDHVNAMIERQKAISKARATRAKKEDEPAE